MVDSNTCLKLLGTWGGDGPSSNLSTICWLSLTTLKAKKKSFVRLLLVSAGVRFFMGKCCSTICTRCAANSATLGFVIQKENTLVPYLICLFVYWWIRMKLEVSMNIKQTLNYFLTYEWYFSSTPDVVPLVFPPPHMYAVLPSQVIVRLPQIPVCRLTNSSGCPVASHPIPTACYSSSSEIKVTHRT